MSSSENPVSDTSSTKKKSLKKKKKDDDVASDLSQVPEEVPVNGESKSDSILPPVDALVSDVSSNDIPALGPDDVQTAPGVVVPVCESSNVEEVNKLENTMTKDQIIAEELVKEVAKNEEELNMNLVAGVDIESERVMTMDQFNERKSFYEKYIQEMQDRLSHEEDAAANLNQGKRKLEGEISNLKKDLENLELALQKVC